MFCQRLGWIPYECTRSNSCAATGWEMALIQEKGILPFALIWGSLHCWVWTLMEGNARNPQQKVGTGQLHPFPTTHSWGRSKELHFLAILARCAWEKGSRLTFVFAIGSAGLFRVTFPMCLKARRCFRTISFIRIVSDVTGKFFFHMKPYKSSTLWYWHCVQIYVSVLFRKCSKPKAKCPKLAYKKYNSKKKSSPG